MRSLAKGRWVRFSLGGVLLGLSTVAFAQLTTFEYPVRPVPGVFFDGTQSGTGLTVDVVALGPSSDFVFSTYYHYQPEGSATWMNSGAPLTQAPLAEYASTGIAAYVRAQWSVATGGQCFDCAYSAPGIANSAWGERQIDVVGARHLVLPASGNAAVRNMKLAKSLQPGFVFSQALLEGGSVWQVKYRNPWSQNARAGWVRFRKRPSDELRTDFLPYDPAFPPPAFLDVPNLNALQRYEAVPVRCWNAGQSTPPATGAVVGCTTIEFTEMVDEFAQANRGTFVIDPTTDRIRLVTRCWSGNDCLPHHPWRITGFGDVIEAGQDADGMARLVIRDYNIGAPASGTTPAIPAGWRNEYELTRVSAMALKEVWPNGVPWHD